MRTDAPYIRDRVNLNTVVPGTSTFNKAIVGKMGSRCRFNLPHSCQAEVEGHVRAFTIARPFIRYIQTSGPQPTTMAPVLHKRPPHQQHRSRSRDTSLRRTSPAFVFAVFLSPLDEKLFERTLEVLTAGLCWDLLRPNKQVA